MRLSAELIVLTLSLGIYVAVGVFMWSVARSLYRIARQLEKLVNRYDLQREADRGRSDALSALGALKAVAGEPNWPLNP